MTQRNHRNGVLVHVISFVTQKGESTTAASVAVAASEQGRRVFVLELDRQRTLSDWADGRQADEGPEFERTDATALDKALATLREAGYDVAVVAQANEVRRRVDGDRTDRLADRPTGAPRSG